MPGSAGIYWPQTSHFRLLSFVVLLEDSQTGEEEGAGVGMAWGPCSIDRASERLPSHFGLQLGVPIYRSHRVPQGVK